MRNFTISCLAIIFALSTFCFAIEVEFHLYPRWNLIAMPCTTSHDTIAEVLPILPPAFTYDATSGSYCMAYTFPASNIGFWAMSLTETTFTIECECVDVPLDICDPMRSVVLNGDTIDEWRIERNAAGCVNRIDLSGMDISDPNCLSGIELYPTLQRLYLDENLLTSIDLSPLASCANLQWLWLGNNQLTSIDLSPLSLCANLLWLIFSSNQLTSINLSPLSSCANLQLFWLGGNQLTSVDLSPLASCDNLHRLALGSNELASIDLSPLSSCPNLQGLYLDYNQLTSIDLSPIWDLDSLEDLYLNDNDLDSASCAQVCNFIDAHPDCNVWTDCTCP